MRSSRLLALASLAVLSACQPPDAALRVKVSVRAVGSAKVRADCLQLTVSDRVQPLKSLVIPMPAGKSEYVFAVLRGADLPADVRLQASGLLGTCADEASLKLNAQGEVVDAVFPEKGVSEFLVNLDPPSAQLDADRDGFVAASKGGIDCRDDDGTIFPGAGQICANTSDTDCDGQGGCDDGECDTATVCADPPDRVRVTSPVTSLRRFECVGPLRVELRNASGPRIAVRDTPVAFSTSLAGVTVHGTASCTDAPLTSQTIAYGQGSLEVYVKADGRAFGAATLTATAARVATPGTAMLTVRPQPVASIAFTSPPRTVTAGQCSAEQVTLELRDAQNRRTDVDAPATVTLSSAPGDVSGASIFFSDGACGTDGAMAQLQPGQGTVAVFLKARRAGAVTLTATPSLAIGPATQGLTVAPAAAHHLAFTNAELTLNTTQSCSAAALVVQLQDAFDNPVLASAPVPVRLSTTGLTMVTFFDTTQCTSAAMTDFSIAAGQSSVSLRAVGRVASMTRGQVIASVTDGSNVADATQSLGVSAGFASKFVLLGSAQSPLAGVCSQNPVTVELQDSASNPASATSNVDFTLSAQLPAADPSFQFFTGAGCQQAVTGNVLRVPAGVSSTQFYFRGNKAQTAFEVRAASTLTPPTTFVAGNTIRAAAPARLVTTGPATQASQAGSCTSTPYTAELQDLFGNPTSFTAQQTVSFVSTPAGATVGPAGACTTDNVALAAGSSTVSFTAKADRTSSYTLVGTVGGFSNAPGVTLNVGPGPSRLEVDTPPRVGAGDPTVSSASVTAGACQRVTLSRRDMFGNDAPTLGLNSVTLAVPPGTAWDFFTSVDCSTGAISVLPATVAMNNTQTVSFSVRPKTAGAHALTATLGIQVATVNFTVAPASPTLIFEAPATGIGTAASTQTAGACLPVTVARKDVYGNDVPLGGSGGALTFNLAAGTTVHTGTPCVAGAGGNEATSLSLAATAARATFYVRPTRSSLTGGAAVQTVDAILASQTATLTLTVNPGSPTLSTVLPAGATANVAADTCVPVTVERRDPFGNLVPLTGTGLGVAVSPAPTGLTVYSSTDCLTGPGNPVSFTSGQSSKAFSLKYTVATTTPLQLTLTLGGQTTTVTLNVTPGPTAALAFVGLPTSATAGQCIGPFTVRRRDAFGNDVTATPATITVSSTPFQFSSAADCAGATVGATVGIPDGQSTSSQLYAVATASGPTRQLTATLGALTTTGSVLVNAAAPASIVFTTAARTFTAGTCAGAGGVITVQLQDTYGNVATAGTGGVAVTAASTATTTGLWFPGSTCTAGTANGGSFSIPAGSSSVSMYYQDTKAGSPTVTVTNGASLVNPTSQQHTVNPGAANKLAFTTSARTFTAGVCGGAAGVITVQLQDFYNNPVSAGAGGRAFTASSTGTASWFSDDTCSTTAAGGAFTIPQGSNSVSLYYSDTKAGTSTVTLANASSLVNPTGQGHTVNAAAASRLAFTSQARTFTAGVCGGGASAITVQLQDAFGNPVNAAAGGQAFTASSTSTGTVVGFFTNTGCTTAAMGGAFTIPQGSNSVSMYYSDTQAGAPTVTLANTSSLTNPTGQAQTVNAAAASRLAFTTQARTFTAGVCGGATRGITVQLQDAFGNPVNAPTGGRAFTASSNSTGTASWFTNQGCTTSTAGAFTIPAGSSSVSMFYQDTKAGSPTVTLTNTASLTNPTGQQQTVNPGAASKLVFTTPVRTFTAGVCGGAAGVITVQLQDSFSNPVSAGVGGQAFTASSNSTGTASWFSDDICSTAAAGGAFTIPEGSNSVSLYYSDTKAGTSTVTLANASSLVNPTGQGHTINAAAANRLAFTSQARTFTAGVCGGAANPITVQLQDAFGNPVNAAAGGQAFTASSTSTGTSVGFFTNTGCTTAGVGGAFTIPQGSNSVSMYYSDTQAGAPTVTLANTSSLTNPTGQAQTVNAAAANRLVFTTQARTFTAGVCGGAAGVITAQLQDAFGNPVNAGAGGQAFTASSNSTGTASWFSNDTCGTLVASGTFTIPQGSNSVSLYHSDTKAGTPTVTLTFPSPALSGAAPTQQHTVDPGPASRLGFTNSPVTVAALGCSPALTVTLQDTSGNPVNSVTNRTVTLSAGAGVAFFSNATCSTTLLNSEVTMTAGSPTVTAYFSADTAASLTLTAASAGLTSGTQAATVTAAAPTKLAVTTAPTTVEAGACQLVTVERRDALDRATSPTSATAVTVSSSPTTGVSLFSNASCTTPLTSLSIASGASTATFYAKGISGSLTGVVPGSQLYTLTAAASGLTSGTWDLTVLPMVRRRSVTCSIAAGASATTCAISPALTDLSRTMLFFQATGTTNETPDDDNVSCRLELNAGAVRVACERFGVGSAVNIEWQTLSFASGAGVSVEHVSGGCTAGGAVSALGNTLPSASVGSRFVLFSTRSSDSGGKNDGAHFFTARLTSDTQLTVSQASAAATCTVAMGYEAQVVTWTGATVVRGVTSGGTATSFTATQATSGQSFLLYSSRQAVSDNGGNDVCARRLRGEITNATTLTFERGCTNQDLQDIAWEVVQLPAGAGTVQQPAKSSTNNNNPAAITFSAVDLTRAVVFMGGQGPGGAATGMTDYTGGDRVGTAQARAVVTSSTGADLTRGATGGISTFSASVLEVNP